MNGFDPLMDPNAKLWGEENVIVDRGKIPEIGG